jgi:hypothetical protein
VYYTPLIARPVTTTPHKTARAWRYYAKVHTIPVPLPTQELPSLYHVGSLQPSQKGSYSYEGAGLSVSRHPHQWRKIARLSGPLWHLTRPGALLLDAHALTNDQRQVVREWGLSLGWVHYQTRYQVTYYDEELESDVRFLCCTRTAALEEVGGDPCATTEEDIITEVLVATSSFDDVTVRPGDSWVEDKLLAAYVDNVYEELEGVWWDDTYNPAALSCPRGVLGKSRLAHWNKHPATLENL